MKSHIIIPIFRHFRHLFCNPFCHPNRGHKKCRLLVKKFMKKIIVTKLKNREKTRQLNFSLWSQMKYFSFFEHLFWKSEKWTFINVQN